MKRRPLTAVTATLFCLIAVTLAGVGTAGASQRIGASRSRADAVRPLGLPAGTYRLFVNGGSNGTLTLTLPDTFTTSSLGSPPDSGSWAQAGKSLALFVTAGGDASYGCTLSGKINKTNTAVGTSAHPSHYACPGGPFNGTWYLRPDSGAPAVRDSNGLLRDQRPKVVRNGLVVGTYNWFFNGSDVGTITFASNNTFTSTTAQSDSGTWVTTGNQIAMAITSSSGADDTEGIVFAGKVSTTGTAISSSAHPGNWASPGYGTMGTWYVS